MADPVEKPAGFKVTDRRSFGASGERKDAPAPAPSIEASGAAPATPQADGNLGSEPEMASAFPPADFATLVLSLGSSAIAYLGAEPGPGEQKPTRNLPMAKHAIDLLSVLEEKTKGNLSPEEAQMLESLLFDLRLRYVEAVKPSAT